MLTIGDSCVVSAECGSATGMPIVDAADLAALLRPLQAMQSLSALEINYVIHAEVAAAVAGLTHLCHLRMSCEGIFGSPGNSLVLRRRLASLDLQDAIPCDCTAYFFRVIPGSSSSEVARVRVLASLSALTDLKKLKLFFKFWEPGTSSAILSTLQGLTCLSHVTLSIKHFRGSEQEVCNLGVNLATMAHMAHVHFPFAFLCWHQTLLAGWQENDEADPLTAIVSASAERLAEIELLCWGYGVDDAPIDAAGRQALADVLPLCTSTSVMHMGGVFGDLLCAGAERLTALTQLDISLYHTAGEAVADAHRLVRSLGLLSGLSALHMCWELGNASHVCDALPGQLKQLLQLTRLTLRVPHYDHRLAPRLLASCRALPSLHVLNAYVWLYTYVALYICGSVHMWLNTYAWLRLALDHVIPAGAEADLQMTIGWDVGGLLSVRTLVVTWHGNLEADTVFWERLKRMPRLQRLLLPEDVDDVHPCALAEQAQRSGCLSLQELHFRDRCTLQRRRRACLVHDAAGTRFRVCDAQQ